MRCLIYSRDFQVSSPSRRSDGSWRLQGWEHLLMVRLKWIPRRSGLVRSALHNRWSQSIDMAFWTLSQWASKHPFCWSLSASDLQSGLAINNKTRPKTELGFQEEKRLLYITVYNTSLWIQITFSRNRGLIARDADVDKTRVNNSSAKSKKSLVFSAADPPRIKYR